MIKTLFFLKSTVFYMQYMACDVFSNAENESNRVALGIAPFISKLIARAKSRYNRIRHGKKKA